jgi:hypothetical protein
MADLDILLYFANEAKRVRDAINERYRARGKLERIDTMDAVELLHAIGRYAAWHLPLDGQATSGASSSLPARRLPDAGRRGE